MITTDIIVYRKHTEIIGRQKASSRLLIRRRLTVSAAVTSSSRSSVSHLSIQFTDGWCLPASQHRRRLNGGQRNCRCCSWRVIRSFRYVTWPRRLRNYSNVKKKQTKHQQHKCHIECMSTSVSISILQLSSNFFNSTNHKKLYTVDTLV